MPRPLPLKVKWSFLDWFKNNWDWHSLKVQKRWCIAMIACCFLTLRGGNCLEKTVISFLNLFYISKHSENSHFRSNSVKFHFQKKSSSKKNICPNLTVKNTTNNLFLIFFSKKKHFCSNLAVKNMRNYFFEKKKIRKK